MFRGRNFEGTIAWATVAPASGGTQFDLAQMTEAGIRVGLGEDGQRDYWSPYGNCDMLHRTWQLAFTHRLRKDRLIEHCAAIATIGGASVMDRGTDRTVIHDGRLVADGLVVLPKLPEPEGENLAGEER